MMADRTTSFSLAESVRQAVALQGRKADLPKYQLERAIDGFLGPLLEEYLALHYDSPVRFLTAEFPVRKSAVGDDDTYQTTNIDYAYLVLAPQPRVCFVELKTDPVSFRIDQLAVYTRLRSMSFAELVEGIKAVAKQTRRADKYAYLLRCITDTLSTAGITVADIQGTDVVYLAPPQDPSIQASSPSVTWVSFESFVDRLDRCTQHQEYWVAVKPLFQLIANRR